VRVAEADLVRVYEKFSANGHGSVDVLAGLAQVMARVTAFADFATARIEALTAEEWAAFSPRTAAEVDLFRQALRDAGRLLTDVARLGLAERALEAEARLSEAMGARVAHAVAAIVTRLGHPSPLTDPEVGAICQRSLASCWTPQRERAYQPSMRISRICASHSAAREDGSRLWEPAAGAYGRDTGRVPRPGGAVRPQGHLGHERPARAQPPGMPGAACPPPGAGSPQGLPGLPGGPGPAAGASVAPSAERGLP
jgi:hypothetical protein